MSGAKLYVYSDASADRVGGHDRGAALGPARRVAGPHQEELQALQLRPAQLDACYLGKGPAAVIVERDKHLDEQRAIGVALARYLTGSNR